MIGQYRHLITDNRVTARADALYEQIPSLTLCIYLFAIDNPEVVGPINAVAPNATRGKEFARALGGSIGRPSWLPVPARRVA